MPNKYIDRLSEETLIRLIEGEEKSSREYASLGLHNLSIDESRHAKQLREILTIKQTAFKGKRYGLLTETRPMMF